MAATREERIAERFRTTLALFELAEQMLRQKLRRKYPQATDAEVEVHVQEWREHRPGAVYGDGAGRPVAWPRCS